MQVCFRDACLHFWTVKEATFLHAHAQVELWLLWAHIRRYVSHVVANIKFLA